MPDQGGNALALLSPVSGRLGGADRVLQDVARASGGGARAAIDEVLDRRERRAADDTVVLPWWQHPLNIVTLVVTAASQVTFKPAEYRRTIS